MSMRHNCETGGCYLKVQTPDWGFLDNSFSGKIRVSDIDGIVEANGKLLILEWKGSGVPITKGQEIMFKKCTERNDIYVFVINGSAKESFVDYIRIFANGKIIFEDNCTNKQLQKYCNSWEIKARNESL